MRSATGSISSHVLDRGPDGRAGFGTDALQEPHELIERILLAIDTPAHSRHAIRLASEIARRMDAEVVVLHVREWILGPRGPFDEGEREAERIVGEVARQLRVDGVRTRVEVRSGYVGHAAREIVNAARTRRTSMIVMDRSDSSELREFLLGSVTDKVLQLADQPVLVACSHPLAS
jgi:nucleotide-binding universal stress UspA family protein